MFRTTSGQPRLENGRVVIRFGYLVPNEEAGTQSLHEIVLDVDAYAEILARDLLIAAIERRDDE